MNLIEAINNYNALEVNYVLYRNTMYDSDILTKIRDLQIDSNMYILIETVTNNVEILCVERNKAIKTEERYIVTEFNHTIHNNISKANIYKIIKDIRNVLEDKNTIYIPNSSYIFNLNERGELKIYHHDADVTSQLNYNIVFDMAYMIKDLLAEKEKRIVNNKNNDITR